VRTPDPTRRTLANRSAARASAEQELIDREAVRAVMLNYAGGVDGRDLARVAALFVPGAVYEGTVGRGTIEVALASLRERLTRYERTMHLLPHQLVEIDGRAAQSETYGVAYHRVRGEAASLVVGVRYVDRLTRGEEGWRIAHRLVSLEWRRYEVGPWPACG